MLPCASLNLLTARGAVGVFPVPSLLRRPRRPRRRRRPSRSRARTGGRTTRSETPAPPPAAGTHQPAGRASGAEHAALCAQNRLPAREFSRFHRSCVSAGIFASWIILLPFSRAIGVLWAPLLFCGAVTVLEGIFCLGMVWKMDTTRMPHAFCVAQAALIGLSSHILTGICACFTIATYLSVFKAQQLTQSSHSTLSWRPQYILLVVVYPSVAFAAHLAVILKTNSLKPTNDMHCDANDPLWPRLLSYAGLPLLIAIPCFVVSTLTAIRVIKANSQSHRYRYSNDDTPSFTRLPVRGRARRTSKRNSGNAGTRTRPTDIFVPSNAIGTVTVTASLDHNPESYPDTERDLKFKNDGATSLSLHSMSGTTATHPHGHHGHSLSAKTSETTIYAPFDPVSLPPPPVPVPHQPLQTPPSPIPSVET
ncbi:hypothetical protein EVG20_g11471, partial [Dentipellis fragilis]